MRTDKTQPNGETHPPLEIPLPSGAVFPDWSLVTSDRVRVSLDDTLGRLRMTTKWVGMGADEETLRRAVLCFYAQGGRAPTQQELCDSTGLSPSAVGLVLNQLEARDLIVLNKTDRSIEGAYPFTDRKTEHRVQLNDVMLNAMCAIDALGVGAMLNCDTVIDSSCRHCGGAIRIETKRGGRAVQTVSPDDVIVWSGLQDIDGCAADTQCKVMVFICSDDHLHLWRQGMPAEAKGHRLTVPEGLEAGAAIFRPFMADGPAIA